MRAKSEEVELSIPPLTHRGARGSATGKGAIYATQELALGTNAFVKFLKRDSACLGRCV